MAKIIWLGGSHFQCRPDKFLPILTKTLSEIFMLPSKWVTIFISSGTKEAAGLLRSG